MGTWTIAGAKTLEGQNFFDGDFYFLLYEANEKGQIPEGAQPIDRVTTKDGNWRFDVDYDKEKVGTLTYVVKEEKGTDPYIIYTDAGLMFQLIISEKDGVYTENLIQPVFPNFVNYLNTSADRNEFEIRGTKRLEGRPLEDGEFTFALYECDENYNPLGSGPLITTNQDGVWSFIVNYSDEDEWRDLYYMVLEVDNGLPGVTYDSSQFHFRVNIPSGDSIKTRAAVPTLIVYRPEVTEFVNYYEPSLVTIEGTKRLEGRSLRDGEFSFSLHHYDGSSDETDPLPIDTTDNQGGAWSFELDVTAWEPGFHQLKVIELDEGLPGVIYDTKELVYAIYIPGGSEPQPYSLDGGEDSSITVSEPEDTEFLNLYESYVHLDLEGRKVLEGRALKEEEFSFELLDNEGQVIDEAKNDADGNFAFYSILFTNEDVGKSYFFLVQEVIGDDDSLVYDTDAYGISVKVLMGEEDQIYLEAEGNEDIVFTNRLKKEEIELADVEAKKVWKGGPDKKPIIWFKLQRNVEGEKPIDVVGASLMKLDGITKAVWQDMPLKDKDGKPYIYSVLEVDEKGKALSLENYTKKEKGLTVTNTYKEPKKPEDKPKLPSTGEAASGPLLGSALLLAVAAFYLLRRKKAS